MNSVSRSRQSHLFGGSVVAQFLAIYLCFTHGTVKPWEQIDWLDIVGEGSVVFFAYMWIVAAIISRPAGKVTRLLVAGLNCFAFTTMLDLMDEWFDYSAADDWLNMLESAPAAVGMVIMSIALWGWHQEQKILNRQMAGREWEYRNHSQIDEITQLYRADYWCARLIELEAPSSAIMLDINSFALFNTHHGYHEGNRFLKTVARLLIMQTGEVDLVCRFAGDRFVILLPGSDRNYALNTARNLEAAVNQLVFWTRNNTAAIYPSARTAVVTVNTQDDSDMVIARLQRQLDGMSGRDHAYTA